ncbi:tail fiber domain-containing protein [Mesobacillus zeae]|uniref:tail fiber domain-containing protein n=1 Tax=Mesobacillus zeae TaxID=1917180 RepID=UPI00300995A3
MKREFFRCNTLNSLYFLQLNQLKENFSNVNKLEILDKLASITNQSWNYKEEPSSVSHIGPTTQDFHADFGLNGEDNKHISNVDIQGVALAAIQGLNEKNEKIKAGNAKL